MHFDHPTGRHYNGPQVLRIHVRPYTYDADGDASVIVAFSDTSRGIAGTVELCLWEGLNDTQRDIARYTLAAYDAGNYILA